MKNRISTLILIFICQAFIGNARIIEIYASTYLIFNPFSVTAYVGDTIRWTAGDPSHTTTSASIPSNAASWDWDFANGLVFEYVITAEGTYNYVCTPHVDFGMVGEIIVESSTGISNNSNHSFSSYPNPFQDYIRLNVRSFRSSVTVEIFDFTGQKHYSREYSDLNSSILIETEELMDGFYFIYAFNNEKKQVLRLLKNSIRSEGCSSNKH